MNSRAIFTSEGGDESISADATPYRRLWQMVLVLALEEARGAGMQGTDPRERGRQTWRARDWLGRPGKDLRYVCDMAGVEAENVIKFVKGRYGK